jgi:hypothetical protein
MAVHSKTINSQEPTLRRRVFLLSPANLSGRRAKVLLREAASFELAMRIRSNGAPLGDVFSFISGLYFRGKLAYATAFAEPATTGGKSIFIITATHGLLSPDECVGHRYLGEMAQVPINCSDPRYRAPLERDLMRLASEIGAAADVVLLGSIATPKYLEPLSVAFGNQLMIPTDFIGRGDMSRGAMLLKAVRDNAQLQYAPVTSLQALLLKPVRRRTLK